MSVLELWRMSVLEFSSALVLPYHTYYLTLRTLPLTLPYVLPYLSLHVTLTYLTNLTSYDSVILQEVFKKIFERTECAQGLDRIIP